MFIQKVRIFFKDGHYKHKNEVRKVACVPIKYNSDIIENIKIGLLIVNNDESIGEKSIEYLVRYKLLNKKINVDQSKIHLRY